MTEQIWLKQVWKGWAHFLSLLIFSFLSFLFFFFPLFFEWVFPRLLLFVNFKQVEQGKTPNPSNSTRAKCASLSG